MIERIILELGPWSGWVLGLVLVNLFKPGVNFPVTLETAVADVSCPPSSCPRVFREPPAWLSRG